MLSKEEFKRYNRHIILSEIGQDGQQKLKNAKVLIIGAGGLGCPIAQYLAAAGIGTLAIIDGDAVDVSNLQRQILFSHTDIGKNKALCAKEKLEAINPLININAYPEFLTTTNALALFKQYDLIVDGTDNFSTRYLINDASVITHKPWVYGSIYKFDGQISVFNYHNGPTYRCLFPDAPNEGQIPNCSQIGVIGVLPGIIGTLQANEVIKIITEIGTPLVGKLLHLDLLTLNNSVFEFDVVPENKTIISLEAKELNCKLPEQDVMQYSVDEINEWIQSNKDFLMIDIRKDYEFEEGTIRGAIHIEANELPDRIAELPRDKDLVLLCKFGTRSKKACELLMTEYGFTNVYNMEGGLTEWSIEIDHSVLIS